MCLNNNGAIPLRVVCTGSIWDFSHLASWLRGCLQVNDYCSRVPNLRIVSVYHLYAGTKEVRYFWGSFSWVSNTLYPVLTYPDYLVTMSTLLHQLPVSGMVWGRRQSSAIIGGSSECSAGQIDQLRRYYSGRMCSYTKLSPAIVAHAYTRYWTSLLTRWRA